MPERGAQTKRDAGDLVRGQCHAEGQPEKDQDGKLDQAGAATGQGREEVCRQRGGKQDELVEHDGIRG